jgi:hypothetical protein
MYNSQSLSGKTAGSKASRNDAGNFHASFIFNLTKEQMPIKSKYRTSNVEYRISKKKDAVLV